MKLEQKLIRNQKEKGKKPLKPGERKKIEYIQGEEGEENGDKNFR